MPTGTTKLIQVPGNVQLLVVLALVLVGTAVRVPVVQSRAERGTNGYELTM